jgi:hypothetical protein
MLVPAVIAAKTFILTGKENETTMTNSIEAKNAREVSKNQWDRCVETTLPGLALGQVKDARRKAMELWDDVVAALEESDTSAAVEALDSIACIEVAYGDNDNDVATRLSAELSHRRASQGDYNE